MGKAKTEAEKKCEVFIKALLDGVKNGEVENALSAYKEFNSAYKDEILDEYQNGIRKAKKKAKAIEAAKDCDGYDLETLKDLDLNSLKEYYEKINTFSSKLEEAEFKTLDNVWRELKNFCKKLENVAPDKLEKQEKERARALINTWIKRKDEVKKSRELEYEILILQDFSKSYDEVKKKIPGMIELKKVKELIKSNSNDKKTLSKDLESAGKHVKKIKKNETASKVAKILINASKEVKKIK